MAFDQLDGVTVLVTLMFVWFEPYKMKDTDREWYMRKLESAGIPMVLQLPPWVFRVAWTVIKLCDVASIFLFQKFAQNNVENWTIPATYGIFLAVQIVSKTWGSTFFEYKYFGLAAIITVVLVLHQAAYVALIAVAQTYFSVLGYLYYVPIILALPRLCWLTFASILGFVWYDRVSSSTGSKRRDKRVKDDSYERA